MQQGCIDGELLELWLRVNQRLAKRLSPESALEDLFCRRRYDADERARVLDQVARKSPTQAAEDARRAIKLLGEGDGLHS